MTSPTTFSDEVKSLDVVEPLAKVPAGIFTELSIRKIDQDDTLLISGDVGRMEIAVNDPQRRSGNRRETSHDVLGHLGD